MKKIIILFIVVVSVQFVEAQGQRHKYPERASKKIEELEKIKLLEVLKMDEETTLKFFNRRNQHKERMRELSEINNGYLDKMDEALKNDNSSGLNDLISAYLDNEKKITTERMNFINSVSEILSREQLASFFVFEQRFREEIRNILLRERRKPRQ